MNEEKVINQKNKEKIGQNARIALDIINKYKDENKNENRKCN